MVGPTASLSQLNRADGSASYKCPATGYNILGAVNAPVELPGRRDALKPEEATVEVFVKPGTTTAGVGERYIEGILRSVLGKVVLGREKGFPRRGVVLTLAIVGGENIERGDSVSIFILFSLHWPIKLTYPVPHHPPSPFARWLARHDIRLGSSVDDLCRDSSRCNKVW
jgi:exosome complex component RRP46